jgi:hypothetical protein
MSGDQDAMYLEAFIAQDSGLFICKLTSMVAVHDTYASQLYSLTRGHAIYHPHPGWDNARATRKQALCIGDVGYMFMGGFQRLFNVHLSRDHPDQGRELPEHFTPLLFDNYDVYMTVSAPQVFCSHSIRAIGAEAEASGSVVIT